MAFFGALTFSAADIFSGADITWNSSVPRLIADIAAASVTLIVLMQLFSKKILRWSMAIIILQMGDYMAFVVGFLGV